MGFDLSLGTLVIAKRHLDPLGANVPMGTLGVVFELAKGYGPMVRWTNLGACNVYDRDIIVVSAW